MMRLDSGVTLDAQYNTGHFDVCAVNLLFSIIALMPVRGLDSLVVVCYTGTKSRMG
jgi:hypothetical protein